MSKFLDNFHLSSFFIGTDNFVGRESFLESNSSDARALYDTNLHDSIDSSNFFFSDYYSRIITQVHDLAVYVKEGLPFARNLFLEHSEESYICFWLALLHSLSYFVFLWRSPSSLCTVFYSISSNIDEVL